jgi:hypothetical protein
MATKIEFCEAYEQELRRMYEWARDESKLARFMHSVQQTIDGENSWNCDGDAVRAALKVIGLPWRTPLKTLRALPMGQWSAPRVMSIG